KIDREFDTSISGEYELNYSVKDKDGNETIVPRKITIITNEKPVIKENEKLILKQGEEFNALYGISAIDKEDGDISNLLKITGKIDTNTPGIYNITYSVVDSQGNSETFTRDILVKSNEKPIIFNTNNMILNLGEPFNELNGIIATDKEDGDLTKNIAIKGHVDTSKVGTYDLIYSVTDNDGNESVSTRRIIIKALNTVEILGVENIEVSYGKSFNPMEGIKAIDFQSKDLTSLIKVEGLVDTNKPGVYDLNYKVKDEFGSELNFFRQITVKSKEESQEISIKNTSTLNDLIKENLEKIYAKTNEIFNKYPNNFIEKTPQVIPNLINENVTIVPEENINKDTIDNIIEPKETPKEKVILENIVQENLPPYDKKPFPLWLLGLLLIILGKKTRKKEDN
ncbi:MAG: immunoglobulin-like domain-containing protein, partial [Sarcina sp.]